MTDDDKELREIVSHLRGDIFTIGAMLMILLVAATIIVTVAANHVSVILCAQNPVEVCKGR